MDMELARKHVRALDELPRPTLVTCGAGSRSSAAVYLYAGLKAGATAEELLTRADADDAPFAANEDLEGVGHAGTRRAFLSGCMAYLRR